MEREIAMSKYLVKLLPLGKFFFGGDMAFKVNNKETAFSSYIIHSFMTPQQTSILGMMRFLILSKVNDKSVFSVERNCINDVEKANGLIGNSGFVISPNHCANDYKSVLKIGPCFVLDTQTGKSYFKGAGDLDLQIDNRTNGIDATINGKSCQIPIINIQDGDKMRLFTGKDFLPHYYQTIKGEKLKEEKLFKEDSRIGINKSYSGKTESEAFYKQISYRLSESFCFAFEVEVADSINLADEKYQKQIVKLGADDSSFVFEAEKTDGINYPVWGSEKKVVLLSDTYLTDLSKCELSFAITEIRPFRFLFFKNNTDAQSYNVVNVIKDKSYYPAKRYDLYQAGSVFYFRNVADKNQFCRHIDSFAEFKQIGYNHYC